MTVLDKDVLNLLYSLHMRYESFSLTLLTHVINLVLYCYLFTWYIISLLSPFPSPSLSPSLPPSLPLSLSLSLSYQTLSKHTEQVKGVAIETSFTCVVGSAWVSP